MLSIINIIHPISKLTKFFFNRILQCGLKGFSGNFENTLDSEVGILSYLAHSHVDDLELALNELFSVTPQANIQQIIPYILHLADMSDVLAQPIVDVFLKICKSYLIVLVANE